MKTTLFGKKIWILVGTRPEVIKQAPVYLACVKKWGKHQVALVGTGQHRELLDQALSAFGLTLDVDLKIMEAGQSLLRIGSKVLEGMEHLFSEFRPSWVVVQGDTTSAAMAGWAAFQSQIRVAHNEAGLRTYDLQSPFPEEANRKLIGTFADLHFAPTLRAKHALLAEGVPEARIHVTGNPGIDSLYFALSQPVSAQVDPLLCDLASRKLRPVLLTAHRRENRGEEISRWFQGLAGFVSTHPDLALVYPMHPNNAGAEAAALFLKPLDRVHLMAPLGYIDTCHLLKNCKFVVTDSGGIQEEAGTLGIPAVVCRKTTERMEGVDAGIARLVSTRTEAILDAMDWADQFSVEAKNLPQYKNLYGDGKSSERQAEWLIP